MNPNNDSYEELVRDAFYQQLLEFRAHLTGRIVSWDETTQLAEVEVCQSPTWQHGDGEEVKVYGIVKNVPIEFPSGGGYFLSFPLAQGDPVKLSFFDHSLDQWIEKGGVTVIEDLRLHHLSDASCYPGMRAKPNALTGVSKSKLIIGKIDDPSMRITIDGSFIKLSENAIHLIALANKAAQWAAALDGVIRGAPVNEPGNGAPSAFQAALLLALTVPSTIPVPSEATWGAGKVKAE